MPITREILTKKWTDWIDYWSVDFDFENRREIVRSKNQVIDIFGNDTMKIVEVGV